LLEFANHPLRGQREVNLHANGLAVEVVNDIEQSERSAVIELVVHEVHGPHLVDTLRYGQGLWLLAHQPLAWLDP